MFSSNIQIFKSSSLPISIYIYQEDRDGGLSILLAILLHQSVVNTVSLNFPSFVLLDKVLVLLDEVAVAVISLGSTSLRLKSTSFILLPILPIADCVDDRFVEEETVSIFIGVRNRGLVYVNDRPILKNLCRVGGVVHIEAIVGIAAKIMVSSNFIFSIANIINVVSHALKMTLKKLLDESAHHSTILRRLFTLTWRGELTGRPKNAAQEVSDPSNASVKPSLIYRDDEHTNSWSSEDARKSTSKETSVVIAIVVLRIIRRHRSHNFDLVIGVKFLRTWSRQSGG